MRLLRPFPLCVALLGLSLLLWVPPILYLCRLNPPVLYRLFLKAPGVYFLYAALFACPLASMILGRRLRRTGEKPVLGRAAGLAGGLLLVTFVTVIGVPVILSVLQARTPLNPSTPRPIEPLVGLPVFPGAEGFGSRTRAGRGGKVIEVTSLADSGPETLRAALEDPNPRTIVFRVSGTIELNKPLVITSPFVTVAGQTAPGAGICVKNAGLIVATNDVLIQHLRIRPGNEGNVDADNNDAIQVFGKHGTVSGAYNVVLDHLSASWSEDEVVSTWFGAHNITISNSIISEALHRSRHRKRTHSAGLLIGDGSYHVSVHHNLLAHNSFRNPLVISGGTHDFVNNIVYNWGDGSGEVVDEDSNSFLNFVGNYYRPGPSSGAVLHDIIVTSRSGTPSIYVEGNLGINRPSLNIDEWAVVRQGWAGEPAPQTYRARNRFPTPPVTTWPAAEALEKVLAAAGASRPRRDSVDLRVVADVRNKTGRVIDSPREVGNFPRLASGLPPADSDHDGMPDEWEREKGLDPNDPSDASKDRDADGYTNLEEYLHSLLAAKAEGEPGG